MNLIRLIIGFSFLFINTSCNTLKLDLPEFYYTRGGEAFYDLVKSMEWEERDALAQAEILGGNIPRFLRSFVPIEVSVFDLNENKQITAQYYVSPDYLSIGDDDDWARIPLTPMTAQVIADSLMCFLPTRKIVDDIYKAAKVKLSPMPMFAFRDSSITMYHHHLIIEGQRKGRKGLIAGIKKDVVLTSRLNRKEDRVAIYGWHKLDNTPIQPLYTGHVNWYVDYSHGIRLVYRKIKVDGKWMDYKEVMEDPVLKGLLCDEEDCSFTRY